jgi:hypothetical protein
METVWDWLTVAIFAGLIVLFLQRSMAETPKDKLVSYAPAAIGCAVANWLGNNHYEIVAVAAVGAILAYIWFVLKPLER